VCSRWSASWCYLGFALFVLSGLVYFLICFCFLSLYLLVSGGINFIQSSAINSIFSGTITSLGSIIYSGFQNLFPLIAGLLALRILLGLLKRYVFMGSFTGEAPEGYRSKARRGESAEERKDRIGDDYEQWYRDHGYT